METFTIIVNDPPYGTNGIKIKSGSASWARASRP
jgi:hypothetical protein